ncbi:MAG: M28 family peptidase [Candidatus Hydrogenedentes bacterium]|nr:M28 family peptidase [Candidatus Hydrogenedentota bacterium]
MNMAQMRRDIEYLAGNLAHRGASTQSERAAADYIRERLLAYTGDTEVDDFFAIESPWFMFASYYAEFLVVALLAFWWPWLSFAYGLLVFVLYMAEFSGYRILAHLLPQYETQNVVARILAPNPKRLFVVTAHYDSPKYSAITSPQAQPWLRLLHLAVVFSMIVVLISCAAEAMGLFADAHLRIDLVLRWTGVTVLLCAAAALASCEISGEFVRGASDNASGVAVLLALAERFTEEPLHDADVWLVATGSKETWLSGMRRFMSGHVFDKETAFFLNVDRVGAGNLFFVTGEGMLHLVSSSREMVAAAEAEAGAFGASALRWRGLPSDAFLPIARGLKALSITAMGGRDTRVDIDDDEDRPGGIDYSTVTHAGAYAEAIIRRIAAA